MKFREVTWYSKILALILFITLPFAGFYAGMKYQQAIAPADDKGNVVDNHPTNGSGWKTIVENDQITVKTRYENDVLKYSGTVLLPNPCYKVEFDALIAESYPEQVTLQVKTAENLKPGTACIQVEAQKEFSGEAKVSEKATVSVYLDGKKVE